MQYLIMDQESGTVYGLSETESPMIVAGRQLVAIPAPEGYSYAECNLVKNGQGEWELIPV